MLTSILNAIEEAWQRNQPTDVSFVWQYVDELVDDVRELQVEVEHWKAETRERYAQGAAVVSAVGNRSGKDAEVLSERKRATCEQRNASLRALIEELWVSLNDHNTDHNPIVHDLIARAKATLEAK